MFQNFHLLRSRTNVPISQVQFLPGFLHAHEIDAIASIVDEFPYQNAAVSGQGNNDALGIRFSQIKWIEWADENWWLYMKLMEKAHELNSSIWMFDLYGINEYIQYTEYRGEESNRGHYDWHLDVGINGISSNRKLTMECILDDDHTGGDLSMLLGPTENRVKLSKGDAIIYPSYLMNKIYPVRTGTRKSIIAWISGPSFR